RPAEAARLQKDVLALRASLGDEDGQARSLHEIGVCLLEAGDAHAALEPLGQALDRRRALADRPGEMSTLQVLAEALEQSGDPSRALERLREARAIAASLADRAQEAEAARRTGDVEMRAGRSRR